LQNAPIHLFSVTLILTGSTEGCKHCFGPCGGRDCSAGCKCFPEKGARVSMCLNVSLVADRLEHEFLIDN
uniref:Uncharacterized protein n=1 Tax=Phasianus colchicus TaxID=9054 RepID=A0A669PJC6_PHACC